MKKVLLIGTKHYVVELAKKFGFYVVLIQQKERCQAETLELVDELYMVDWSQWDYVCGLSQVLNQKHSFSAVLAYGEENVELASIIQEKLGIPIINPHSAVYLAKNKYEMRKALSGTGTSIRYSRCEQVDNLYQSVHEVGLPVICKPVNGTGSQGVCLIEDESQLIDYIRKWEDEGDSSRVVLVEEFLAGPEYSVEAFSYEGKHSIVAITEKSTTGAPFYIETGHITPAKLPFDLIEEIHQCTIQTLQTIGHTFGPSHTELKRTSQGVRVIETHTRPGGDRIADLVYWSTGVDLFALVFQFIRDGKVEIAPKELQVASIQFIFLSTGEIAEIQGIEEVQQHPAVREIYLPVKEGDFVSAPIDSQTRHGYYIVQAENHEKLQQSLKEIQSLLKITVCTEGMSE